jgi:hypothetical protein
MHFPLPCPTQVLAVIKEASADITAPIVMFTYYNPIMARGLDKFCRQAKEAGASGRRRRRGAHRAASIGACAHISSCMHACMVCC